MKTSTPPFDLKTFQWIPRYARKYPLRLDVLSYLVRVRELAAKKRDEITFHDAQLNIEKWWREVA